MARWTHTDDSDRFAGAIARAKLRAWHDGDPALRVADLRTLLSLSCVAAGRLLDCTDGGPSFLLVSFDAAHTDRAERAQAAAALMRSWYLLTRSATAGPPEPPPSSLSTAAPSVEAGAIPVVVMVAGVVATAAVAAFAAWTAADVLDRDLDREAQQEERGAQRASAAQAMADTHARFLELLDQHAKREATAGGPVPLNAAERAALAALEKGQQAFGGLLKAQGDLPSKGRLPNPFPNLRNLPTFGAGLGAGALLAAAVALYLITSKGNR